MTNSSSPKSLNSAVTATEHRRLPALLPRTPDGAQFVFYGDCCSGIPGGEFEGYFAAVNAVLQRLQPQPEFIAFLGI